MQAIYAWYCTDYQPAKTFEYNLEEFADEIRSHEQQKGDKGDLRLLTDLFYGTIERREEFDQMIQRKAENWELERIALLDRILMQMGICEMLTFAEIPIKVTINEYLEIAKKFSTPKSSKFINGILDSLFIELKREGHIEKRGRGLIEESLPKGKPQLNKRRRPRMGGDFQEGPPRGGDRFRDRPPRDDRFGDRRGGGGGYGNDQRGPERRGPGRFGQDRPSGERFGSRPRVNRNTGDRSPGGRFGDRPPRDDRFNHDRPRDERFEEDRPRDERFERNESFPPPQNETPPPHEEQEPPVVNEEPPISNEETPVINEEPTDTGAEGGNSE